MPAQAENHLKRLNHVSLEIFDRTPIAAEVRNLDQCFFVLRRQVGEWSFKNFGEQLSKWTRSNLCHDQAALISGPTPLGHVNPFLGFIEETLELYSATVCPVVELGITNRQVALDPVLEYINVALDAVGDMMIYLADFEHRLRPAIPDQDKERLFAYDWILMNRRSLLLWDRYQKMDMPVRMAIVDLTSRLPIYLDRLTRAFLKRHQGIRGEEVQLVNLRESICDILTAVATILAMAHDRGGCNITVEDATGISIRNPVMLMETGASLILLYAAEKTWKAVSQRNWKADPVKGGRIDL